MFHQRSVTVLEHPVMFRGLLLTPHSTLTTQQRWNDAEGKGLCTQGSVWPQTPDSSSRVLWDEFIIC